MREGELPNVLTHGFGVAASVAAAAILIVFASLGGNPAEIVGVSVFGATLILLYLASTLYHAARSDVARARLKVFDHAAIYFLIAGTYTPFTIGALGGGWGWSLFGVIWGLALAGAVFKIFAAGRFRLVSTIFYVAMGWLVVIAAGPLVRHIDATVLAWLLAGGIAYTVGTPFYHTRRFRHAHAVWHGFVLVGSACHAVAVGLQL
ncbi:MAG: hemolysin III family protein [Gemmatimonadota bacterium]|jgi:hemolysin III